MSEASTHPHSGLHGSPPTGSKRREIGLENQGKDGTLLGTVVFFCSFLAGIGTVTFFHYYSWKMGAKKS